MNNVDWHSDIVPKFYSTIKIKSFAAQKEKVFDIDLDNENQLYTKESLMKRVHSFDTHLHYF